MDFLVHITFTWPAGITAEEQQPQPHAREQ